MMHFFPSCVQWILTTTLLHQNHLKAFKKFRYQMWFHSVAVSMFALHIEGPGFTPQWSHSPWSMAMPP